jgi:putative spermidine/putrescine transport system ATP-binding protein
LFPHLTVAKNIAFPLKMHRAAAAEVSQGVAAALELVRLSEHEHKVPSQFVRRPTAACGASPPWCLVLMDEPLGALDKSLRGQMQLEIAKNPEQMLIS